MLKFEGCILDSFSKNHFLEDGFIFQLRSGGQNILCIKAQPPMLVWRNLGDYDVGGNCIYKHF